MFWLFQNNEWWYFAVIDPELVLLNALLHGKLPIVVDNALLLEIDDEVGALAHLTFNVDRASVCVDDFFADAEAQTHT